MRLNSAFLLLVIAVITACAPGASVLAPPSFTVVSEQTGLVRLEPPGVGNGAAVFRLVLDARNPNPIGVQLAGLDGDFYLEGRRVAASRFTDGIALPAQGVARLTLDVEAPLAEAPHLLAQLARLMAGETVAYRLDGTVSVDVLGTRQRYPSLTLAGGDLRAPGPLALPEVRFHGASTGVRIEGLRAHIDVGLEIRNDTFLGFEARGPDLLLLLDGRVVGRARMPVTPVPAFGTAVTVLRVEAGLPELGAALFAQLQGAPSTLQVAVDGDIAFSVPGVVESSLTLARLTSGL